MKLVLRILIRVFACIATIVILIGSGIGTITLFQQGFRVQSLCVACAIIGLLITCLAIVYAVDKNKEEDGN